MTRVARGSPHFGARVTSSRLRRQVISGNMNNRAAETGKEQTHRVNREIRISPILVIGPDGEKMGIMSADEARAKAEEFGLDLVEVAANVRPPVCRIMDFGKFRYELSKKKTAGSASKIEMKTLRFRPSTDDHDLDNKLKNADKFLVKGHKVKLVMRMRGRERAYTNRWVDDMNDILKALNARHEPGIRVVDHPRNEGRQITAVVESAG